MLSPLEKASRDEESAAVAATALRDGRRRRRRWLRGITAPLKVGAGELMVRVGRLLPERAAVAMGVGVARMAFPFDRRRRATLFENLERAFGDQLDAAARKRLGRRVYQHLGRLGIELVLLRSRGLEYFDGRIDFEVEHPVFAGDLSQRPIMVTAHLGNWELGAAAVTKRGLPLLGVAYDLGDRGIGGAAEAFRREANVATVPERNAVRALLRGYARGQAPGLLMDIRTDENAVMVPFFGHDAATSPAAALLALRTGAPILPIFCTRTHGGSRYRVFAGTPIVADRSRPFRDEIMRITTAVSHAIEEAVRAYPDQWYWCYRRWRTTAAREGSARAWRRPAQEVETRDFGPICDRAAN